MPKRTRLGAGRSGSHGALASRSHRIAIGECALVDSAEPTAEPTAEATAAPTVALKKTALAELMTLAVSLVIGLLVMPCLIFTIGQLTLGDYAHGGLFAFWRDFLVGLVRGSQAFWFVALAPYLLVWLVRATRRMWRTRVA
jgi:hypothetical protein